MSGISGITGTGGSGSAWATASQQQKTSHQARVFAKTDGDGSGTVDKTELTKLLSDVKQKTGVDAGDSAELFGKMDSDGNGSLSSEELSSGMKSVLPPPPSTVSFAQSRGSGESSSPDGVDLFASIDGNGDDVLNSEEVAALAQAVQSETGQDISEGLAQLDADGDGQLSKSELAAAFKAEQGPPGGGPPPPGGPGGAGAAGGPQGAAGSASGVSSTDESSTTYDALDVNQDGVVSELERLAGNLQELAQQNSDSSGDTTNATIAALAQKLYDQISKNWLSDASSSEKVSFSA